MTMLGSFHAGFGLGTAIIVRGLQHKTLPQPGKANEEAGDGLHLSGRNQRNPPARQSIVIVFLLASLALAVFFGFVFAEAHGYA